MMAISSRKPYEAVPDSDSYDEGSSIGTRATNSPSSLSMRGFMALALVFTTFGAVLATLVQRFSLQRPEVADDPRSSSQRRLLHRECSIVHWLPPIWAHSADSKQQYHPRS